MVDFNPKIAYNLGVEAGPIAFFLFGDQIVYNTNYARLVSRKTLRLASTPNQTSRAFFISPDLPPRFIHRKGIHYEL